MRLIWPRVTVVFCNDLIHVTLNKPLIQKLSISTPFGVLIVEIPASELHVTVDFSLYGNAHKFFVDGV